MQALNLNPVDIIIICIIGFTFTFGIKRGMVDSIFSVISYYVAFYGTNRLADTAAPLVSKLVEGVYASKLISYIILFLGILFFMKWLNTLAVKFLKFIGLSAFDKTMGGIIGLAKGAVISCMCVILISVFMPSFTPVLDKAKSVKLLSPLRTAMENTLPKYIEKVGKKAKKR